MNMKKGLSVMLSSAMVAGMMVIPITASAEDAITVASATELRSAISNATSGATIKLTGNISITNDDKQCDREGFFYDEGEYYCEIWVTQNITLDLNGYNITQTGYGNAIRSFASLTVTNSGSSASTITGINNAISNTAQGTLVIAEDDIILNSGDGDGSGIWNGGTATISGGSYTGYWDGIYNCGTATISGGTFNGYYEASVYNDGEVTISGGTFDYILDGSGDYTITGGRFKDKPEDSILSSKLQYWALVDGYYEMATGEAVVERNGVQYAEINSAFMDAVSASGEQRFKLLKDAEATRYTKLSSNIAVDKSYVIDLNGHDLIMNKPTNASTTTIFTVKTGGTLEFTDSDPGNDNHLIFKGKTSADITNIQSGGKLILNNIDLILDPTGNITTSTSYSVFKVSGTMEMISSSIYIPADYLNKFPPFYVDSGANISFTDSKVTADVLNYSNSKYNIDSGKYTLYTTQENGVNWYNISLLSDEDATFQMNNIPSEVTVKINNENYISGTVLNFKKYQVINLEVTDDEFHRFVNWGDTSASTKTSFNYSVAGNTVLNPVFDIVDCEEITAVENVYTVTKPEQLNYLSSLAYYNNEDFAGKTIKLDADLDYTNKSFYPINGKYNYSGNSLSVANTFKGEFDGNGKTISNMTVEYTPYAALIGGTGTTSYIHDLTIEDSTFKSDYMRAYAGAFVGEALGTISNVTANNVSALDYNGKPGAYCGGIVGHTWGMTMNNVKVNNVTALAGLVGGGSGLTVNGAEITGNNTISSVVTRLVGSDAVSVSGIVCNEPEHLLINSNGDRTHTPITLSGDNEVTAKGIIDVSTEYNASVINITSGTYEVESLGFVAHEGSVSGGTYNVDVQPYIASGTMVSNEHKSDGIFEVKPINQVTESGTYESANKTVGGKTVFDSLRVHNHTMTAAGAPTITYTITNATENKVATKTYNYETVVADGTPIVFSLLLQNIPEGTELTITAEVE